MASLAFVRHYRPYVGQGAYCYLPQRPLWYSLALSWVPRYLIFIIILVLYASIYSYVRYKFSGFTKLSKRISIPPNDRVRTTSKESGFPSPPPLITHNSTPTTGQMLGTGSERSMTGSYDQVPISPEPQAHRFMWTSFVSGETSTLTESTIPSLQITMTTPSEDYFTTQSTPHTLEDSPPSANSQGQKPKLPSPPNQAHLSPQQPQTPNPLGIDIFTLLNQRPEVEDDPAPVALQLVNSRGADVTISEMIQTRDKIRRQLRHLFIYPLAYIGMWLVPLICQILQFDDRFAANLPFGLRCLSTICLCSQAAIECWLFSSREKPWKHISQTNSNFTSSLRFWSGWNNPASEVKAAPRPGRTKDEVVRETRAAYQRRNVEIAERQSETEQPRPFNVRGDRMWWDAAGMETAMTPVFEEPVNPMDSILAANSPPMERSPRTSGIRTLKV
jgi:G protein-coupled receptor GPR1